MENSQGRKILVIDDEGGMREGCRRTLASERYVVDTASDAASGLAMARSQEYALYLIDVMLPDGSGLDLLDPLLEQDPNAICIIITGFGSIEMAVEAVRRGAYDFLSKPFTSGELLLAVSQGFERRHLKAIEVQAEELAQAKAELEKLDEVKSQLMLKVAHELRAPVAAVQSYVGLMLAGYLTGDELKPTLERVGERLEAMLDLISDLLDLAHLKQARDQFIAEASPQPMAEVLEEVCDLFREQAQQKNQTVAVDIQDRPTIMADRNHLKQIWTNLISNAIKYTPNGGRIAISLRMDKDRVIGTVADSGIGIAEGDMRHLFQEFFRTDQAKASGAVGTGLGLSIVKEIVDSYGGEIRVTSQIGQGSQFTVTLPLEPREPVPEEKPTRPKPRPTKRTGLPATHARVIVLGEEPAGEDGP